MSIKCIPLVVLPKRIPFLHQSKIFNLKPLLRTKFDKLIQKYKESPERRWFSINLNTHYLCLKFNKHTIQSRHSDKSLSFIFKKKDQWYTPLFIVLFNCPYCKSDNSKRNCQGLSISLSLSTYLYLSKSLFVSER